DGVRTLQPIAHGKSAAPLLRPADRHRDRRHGGEDQRLPAGAGRHDEKRLGDLGEGAGSAIWERGADGARRFGLGGTGPWIISGSRSAARSAGWLAIGAPALRRG